VIGDAGIRCVCSDSRLSETYRPEDQIEANLLRVQQASRALHQFVIEEASEPGRQASSTDRSGAVAGVEPGRSLAKRPASTT